MNPLHVYLLVCLAVFVLQFKMIHTRANGGGMDNAFSLQLFVIDLPVKQSYSWMRLTSIRDPITLIGFLILSVLWPLNPLLWLNFLDSTQYSLTKNIPKVVERCNGWFMVNGDHDWIPCMGPKEEPAPRNGLVRIK